MKKICFSLFLATSLFSCHPEGRVYVEHQKLSPDVEWLKEDTKEFQIPIEDTHQAYAMSLSFRYAFGYQFQTAEILVKEMSPSGKETIHEYSLKIREDNGDYIGDAGYDIWDSEHLVETHKVFQEQGTYTYTVEHNMPADPLYFAMEVGIILDEKK